MEEYRPIAILPTLAKIFEHIIMHIKINKQSVDFCSLHLLCGGQVDILYLDLKNTFDRVNNDTLLEKLSAIGFTLSLLRFKADYLCDWQNVHLGLYEPQHYHTRFGMGQGSILGPLLFIIMINKLPRVIKRSQCLLCADDLKLYLEIKTVND